MFDSWRRAGARSRVIAALTPAVVLIGLLIVIGWSAWPLLRPARGVEVEQAIFDRSAAARDTPAPGSAARDAPTVQAPGWLEAEPYIVACTALADGVVESIEALEGDFVERGDVVARLIAKDSQIRLRRAEAELDGALAMLAIAQAEHRAAELTLQEPFELEGAVATGRASLAESEAELAQLPSLISSARATLIQREEEAERVRRSHERGGTNEFELIVTEQQAAAQRADLAALTARRAILEARVERFRADLRAAERALELRIEDRRRLDAAAAGAASAQAAVRRAEALRDEAALELERMVIRAPISGFVQRRLKAPGDKVIRMMDAPESAQIMHLYDPERIQVRVDVPLADASHVFVGQACEVVVEVLPDRVFRGEVIRITHEADLQKNTLQVKVKVFDPDPMLRPAMLTRVKFLPPGRDASSGDDASPGNARRVLVPADAVDRRSDAARLWLVTERRRQRGVLASRSVSIVDRAGEWLTITGDVQPGDLIAVGVDRPREGERVVIRGGNGGRAQR